ncbi:MAG: hypothetical protein J6H18_00145 [Lachnospiraceae bacterium]|nr:hypothetical protein [Lachnospiraceae bacterium]
MKCISCGEQVSENGVCLFCGRLYSRDEIFVIENKVKETTVHLNRKDYDHEYQHHLESIDAMLAGGWYREAGHASQSLVQMNAVKSGGWWALLRSVTKDFRDLAALELPGYEELSRMRKSALAGDDSRGENPRWEEKWQQYVVEGARLVVQNQEKDSSVIYKNLSFLEAVRENEDPRLCEKVEAVFAPYLKLANRQTKEDQSAKRVETIFAAVPVILLALSLLIGFVFLKPLMALVGESSEEVTALSMAGGTGGTLIFISGFVLSLVARAVDRARFANEREEMFPAIFWSHHICLLIALGMMILDVIQGKKEVFSIALGAGIIFALFFFPVRKILKLDA